MDCTFTGEIGLERNLLKRMVRHRPSRADLGEQKAGRKGRGAMDVNRPWYAFYPNGVPVNIELPHICLYDLLARTAREYPEQLAVIDGEKNVTYAELQRIADRFAAVLYRLGLRKGDRIAVMLPNCLEYIVSYYAIQRLGGILVQVNPMYQQSELAYLLEDSEATAFIGHREQKQKLALIGWDAKLTLIMVEGASDAGEYGFYEEIAAVSAEPPSVEIDPREDIAVLQYTGGTTGRAKGVMLTHYNLVSNVLQSFAYSGGVFERPSERILSVSPFFHVYGMTGAMNIAVYGAATIICLRRFEVNHTLEVIRKYRPTFFPGVPTMYIALLQHPDAETVGLDSFKVCNSGSAPMPVEVMHQFEGKTGARIIEGYGLSEAAPITHRNPIHGKRKPGSIGLPLPNTDSKVVDLETGTVEMPPGEPGELIIKGPQVMKGYWKKPEETAAVLRDGWLYTGDIATMDEEGYFYIVGRKKEMIIASGYNIYPIEVEEVIYQHPAVAEACVFGVPDPYRGETVMAVIVPKNEMPVTEKEIIEWCSARLAKYKVPRSVEFRDRMPKTAVGKILRRSLVEEVVEKQKSVGRTE
jgi:long-chain acyl-CoA synthetase